MRVSVGLFVAGVALCGLLAACGGGSSSSATSDGPNFKLYVTDAPFPGDLVESATVVIREVRVRDTEGGWQVVFSGSEEIDLVPLTGGVVSLLTEIDLEPGSYDDMRLIVDAGTVVLSCSGVAAAITVVGATVGEVAP